eukprot:7282049-Pyramimonas_sp.AAC.1
MLLLPRLRFKRIAHRLLLDLASSLVTQGFTWLLIVFPLIGDLRTFSNAARRSVCVRVRSLVKSP